MNRRQRLLARAEDPRRIRIFAGLSFLLWLAVWPLAYIFGWFDERVFVGCIVLMALTLSSLDRWQIARVTLKLRKEKDRDEHRPAAGTPGTP